MDFDHLRHTPKYFEALPKSIVHSPNGRSETNGDESSHLFPCHSFSFRAILTGRVNGNAIESEQAAMAHYRPNTATSKNKKHCALELAVPIFIYLFLQAVIKFWMGEICRYVQGVII